MKLLPNEIPFVTQSTSTDSILLSTSLSVSVYLISPALLHVWMWLFRLFRRVSVFVFLCEWKKNDWRFSCASVIASKHFALNWSQALSSTIWFICKCAIQTFFSDLLSSSLPFGVSSFSSVSFFSVCLSVMCHVCMCASLFILFRRRQRRRSSHSQF